jgi:hypothetical protein
MPGGNENGRSAENCVEDYTLFCLDRQIKKWRPSESSPSQHDHVLLAQRRECVVGEDGQTVGVLIQLQSVCAKWRRARSSAQPTLNDPAGQPQNGLAGELDSMVFLESGGESRSSGRFFDCSGHPAAVFDDPLFNQHLNGSAAAFIEHACDIGYCQPVVDE